MEIENLINNLNRAADDWEEKHPVTYTGNLRVQDALRDAASALSTLQDENAQMEKQLSEFSSFLSHMTGNRLSKTNYTAEGMITAAEDYQQENCENCELQEALDDMAKRNDDLLADCEIVKAERDAAVEDLRKHRKYKCDCCYYADKQSRFPCTECQSPISTYGDGWKWRGQRED